MPQTGLTLGTAAVSEAGPNLNRSSPTSVLIYGTPRATAGFTSNNALSDPLVVSAFDLPIPVGNTILGIQVELTFMQNQGSAPGHIVSVILRDATGDNSTLDFNPTAFATNNTLTFGDSTNLWAPYRPWTYVSVADDTFAVAIVVGSAASGTFAQTLGVGSVRVNVWHECRFNAHGMGRMGIGIGGW